MMWYKEPILEYFKFKFIECVLFCQTEGSVANKILVYSLEY